MRRPPLRTASILSLVTLIACGMSRLPAPSYTQQVSSAYTQVPFPPPPARVEYVPAKPQSAAVWIDGEWTWEGTRYAWKRGRWVVPPSNAKFSPWTGTRDATGVYYVAEGAWRDESGKDLPDPPELAHGSPRGGTPVTPEGENVGPTPVIDQNEGGRSQRIESDAAPDALPIVPSNDASPLETDGGAT